MQKQNDEALSLGTKKDEEIRTKANERREQKMSSWKKKWKGNGMHQVKAVGRVPQAREKQRSRLAAFPQTGLDRSSSISAIKR